MVETHDTRTPHDKSLGDLIRDLSEETSQLIRQEIALAKAEMTEKGKKAAVAGGMFGAAAFVGLLAAGVLSACFVLALNLVLPAWAAALIIAGLYLVVAGILALVGRSALKRMGSPVPKMTAETVKEDIEWARHRTRSAMT